MTSKPADLDSVVLDASAAWQEARANDDDLALVRLSVLQVSRGLSALASSEEVRRPVAETRAHKWSQSPANWATSEGSTHVDNAFGGIRTVCVAAAEHMDVLVDSVQRGRATVTAWTLSRAVLESLGRVNYMLSAADELDFLSRHVALIRAEMKYAGHSVHIMRDVGPLDVDKYVSDMQVMIHETGGTLVPRPTYTELATALLEEAAPDNGSRMRYSQLSGVAHGELSALQMFLTRDGLVLPRTLLVEAAHMVCATAVLVGDKLRDVTTTTSSRSAARWTATRDRALSAAFALLPGAEPETDPNATVAER